MRYFETTDIIEFLKLGAMTVNEARGLMGLGRLQDNLENEDFFAHIPELEEKGTPPIVEILGILDQIEKRENYMTLEEALAGLGDNPKGCDHDYLEGFCIYCLAKEPEDREEESEPEVDFNAS